MNDDERAVHEGQIQQVIEAFGSIAETLLALHSRLTVLEEVAGIDSGPPPPILSLVPDPEDD